MIPAIRNLELESSSEFTMMPSVMLLSIRVALFLLALIAPIRLASYAGEDNASKPILQEDVIPGVHLYLHRFTTEVNKWSDYQEYAWDLYTKCGINVERFKAPTITESEEIWYSITKEEMNKAAARSIQSIDDPEKLKEIPDYWIVSAERYYLKSDEVAQEWAKTLIFKWRYTEEKQLEGIIGDKCWMSQGKTSFIFTKSKMVICLNVTRRLSDISADYMIDIGKHIAKKL